MAWKVSSAGAHADVMKVPVGDRTVTIVFRDVGGLIDLIIADPEILHLLFRYLAGDAATATNAETAFRDWRHRGQRLERVGGLLQIAEMPEEARERLERVATVFSGQRGIVLERPPDEVLSLLGGAPDAALVSAPSGTNFQIREETGSILGVVRLPLVSALSF